MAEEVTVNKMSTTKKMAGSATAASTIGIIMSWIWTGFAIPAGLPPMTNEVAIAFAAVISAIIAHVIAHKVPKPPE